MKIQIISILSILLFVNCNNANEISAKIEKEDVSISSISILKNDTVFTFEDDKIKEIPKNCSHYYTGKEGEKPNWQIVDDKGNKVLAQLTKENPNYHFNVLVFDEFKAKNMELTVRMKAIDGRMDQGGGFVWRFIDADNYYVVRANPLEDNFVLYKVENGKRSDLPLVGKGRTYGADVETLGSKWNTLKLKVKNNIFTVYLNGKEIFQVADSTFTKAGKVGLWTKADAVSYFDDFEIKILE